MESHLTTIQLQGINYDRKLGPHFNKANVDLKAFEDF